MKATSRNIDFNDGWWFRPFFLRNTRCVQNQQYEPKAQCSLLQQLDVVVCSRTKRSWCCQIISYVGGRKFGGSLQLLSTLPPPFPPAEVLLVLTATAAAATAVVILPSPPSHIMMRAAELVRSCQRSANVRGIEVKYIYRYNPHPLHWYKTAHPKKRNGEIKVVSPRCSANVDSRTSAGLTR